MNLLTDLLKGKKLNYMTAAKVNVQLEIESVEEKHQIPIWNPLLLKIWWPDTKNRTAFEVKFTSGFIKSYGSLYEIEKALVK